MSLPVPRRSRRRIVAALVVLAAAVASVGLAASPASAASQYYFGNASTNLSWPYCSSSSGCPGPVAAERHTLTATSARTVNGRTVCTTALNYPGGEQSGAVVCSASLAVKDNFCGCVSRWGWSRSTYDNPVPQGRAQQTW